MWQLSQGKKHASPRHCKATVSILCLYVILYTLFLNYIPPPPPPTHTHTLPHSFAYFLISGYLLLTPDISEVNCIAVALTPEPIKYDPNIICTLLGYIPKIWSILKKLEFLLKLNLDTCTATEVSKLSCHTHCIVNTQIRTRPLRPPKCYHTQNYPTSWKKVQ